MNYIVDNENLDITNIRPKPSSSDIHGSINILNTIVQHPYIEHLDHSIIFHLAVGRRARGSR